MIAIRIPKQQWRKAWRAMIAVAPVRLVSAEPVYEVLPAHLELLNSQGGFLRHRAHPPWPQGEAAPCHVRLEASRFTCPSITMTAGPSRTRLTRHLTPKFLMPVPFCILKRKSEGFPKAAPHIKHVSPTKELPKGFPSKASDEEAGETCP